LFGKDKHWNFFDAFLVLLALLGTIGEYSSSLAVFRVFRVLRLVFLIKLVHGSEYLESSRLMFYGIKNCILLLFWVIMLLMLIMYAFRVFFMSCIVNHLQGQYHVQDPNFMEGLELDYGTIFKTMCVLFEGISGSNDWAGLAADLRTIGDGYYLCFALYAVFVTLGVLNIVTGFFVDGTMQASANQKEVMMKAAQEKRTAMMEMLGELFVQLDTDRSGNISQEELESNLFDESLQEYFCLKKPGISSECST